MEDLRSTIGPALAERYTIADELGRGGAAVVYLAHDQKHDRKVAIKVLRSDLAHAIGTERFQREIEVVAGLTHPHILPLHDSGVAAGLLYYVMPYVEGETLQARLQREGRLSVADAVRITRDVAGALGFAHRRGVVHRDVKPANILLVEDHALLADFGIAYLAGRDATGLTGTGLTVGTPAYLSPEQATGERDIDGRSDVYSLGCVLYEALTGSPPFTATSMRALVARHLVDTPARVGELRHGISEGLEAVVHTALRKSPKERFQSADEMAASLGLLTDGREAMAAAAARRLLGPRHRWLRGKRLAVVACVASVVLVAGILALREALRTPVFAGTFPRYAVLPFVDEQAMSEDEVRLSRDAAKSLRWHLMDWESIEVVAEPAMEGPTMRVARAGFAPPTASLSAAQELVERLNASHLIYVYARMSGDSVELAADIHRAGERQPESSVKSEGLESEVELLTADLALKILGLHDQAASMTELLNRSPNHTANQQFIEGREALRDWRLADAEEHFRIALREDPEFALAHHYLAMTLYWRVARDRERLLDVGPDIMYHANRADRFGTGTRLRAGERDQVDAFRSFWSGDYRTARARYDSILARDPTDLDALVLAGAVEYQDPWLRAGSGGALRPEQDLTRARALFDSAVALHSGQQLAWGRLFDIDRKIAQASLQGICPAFQPPGRSTFPPYEFPESADQQGFCPYLEDGTVRWRRSSDTLATEAREAASAEVRELRARTVERLVEWASVERDQPRAHDELADWMLWERSLRGCGIDPLYADSLLHEARDHRERALALRGDTTPEDRVRLAVLLLASGDTTRALRETESALDAIGDWRSRDGTAPRLEAANVYLAIGRGPRAAAIMERVWNSGNYAVTDPDSEGVKIPAGPVGTAPALWALGTTGSADSTMLLRFGVLERTWAGRTPRETAILRSAATFLVSPALVRLPERWDEWFSGWGDHGLEIPAAWMGLRIAATDTAEARAYLGQAVGELTSLGNRVLRASDFYMPIVLAERLGADSVAAGLIARARSCPLNVRTVDLGWGMGDLLTESEED